MFVLEEPKSRKRRRTSQEPTDIEQVPVAKKQKSILENPVRPHHRPPSFWDTLSKVRLSRSALTEFDRRNIQETCQPYSILTPVAKYPNGRARQRLKRFARRGGPDLSRLRGFANSRLPADDTMSNSTDSQSRKRSSASSRQSASTRTSKISTKDGNFEQKMIDNGIYPSLYEYPDGRSEKPANLDDIQGRLPAFRPSLSPSRFTDKDFEALQRGNARASSETTAMTKAIPIIAGNEDERHQSQGDIWFTNLEKFDEDLIVPKLDAYYGAQPSAIHERIRADLGPHIIPSKADTTRPAAQNFFLEGKSAQGRGDVAKRQALYDGAVGARAMHKLQNYGADEQVYNNKAYSYPCTYQPPLLQIYATHPTKPLTPGGQPEYHMTKLKGFDMTSDKETFIKGATAYRNTRDLAMTHRDGFIDQANQAARQMPTSSPTTTFTDSRTSLSAPLEGGSDASKDELARDDVVVKRLRPQLARHPSSQESATGRYYHTRSS